MKLHSQLFVVATLLLVAARPALAQVDQVAVRTTGISCGPCAAVSEIYLRRLPAIDRVTISISKEAVKVFYRAGSSFQPADIRAALKKTDVGVAEFQIGARGRVEEQGGKRFFVAGKDRFLLTRDPNGPTLPASQFLSVEGIVNDRSTPVELKVTTFKVLN